MFEYKKKKKLKIGQAKLIRPSKTSESVITMILKGNINSDQVL